MIQQCLIIYLFVKPFQFYYKFQHCKLFTMPFGLKFKRTRRYDISTKNVFVVVVEMLDHTYLECTLNSDSTGQECLESLAQRIELTQVRYI